MKTRAIILVERAQKGCPVSFIQLLDHILPVVYRIYEQHGEDEITANAKVKTICTNVWDFIIENEAVFFVPWFVKGTVENLIKKYRVGNKYQAAEIKTINKTLIKNGNVRQDIDYEDIVKIFTKEEYELLVFRTVYQFTTGELSAFYDASGKAVEILYRKIKKKYINLMKEEEYTYAKQKI